VGGWPLFLLFLSFSLSQLSKTQVSRCSFEKRTFFLFVFPFFFFFFVVEKRPHSLSPFPAFQERAFSLQGARLLSKERSEALASGCQPQRLARVEKDEEREREDDADDKSCHRFEHANSIVAFRGLCFGAPQDTAACSVALRQDEPPCGVAAAEVDRRERERQRREGKHHEQQQGRRRRSSPSSFYLFCCCCCCCCCFAPPRLKLAFFSFGAARRLPQDAPETGSGIGVGARVRRKQPEECERSKSRRSIEHRRRKGGAFDVALAALALAPPPRPNPNLSFFFSRRDRRRRRFLQRGSSVLGHLPPGIRAGIHHHRLDPVRQRS